MMIINVGHCLSPAKSAREGVFTIGKGQKNDGHKMKLSIYRRLTRETVDLPPGL